jgi:hypothetical protein
MPTVSLRDIALTRAGDKGESSNVMVSPYDDDDYEWLCEHLTVDVVRERFAPLVDGDITRYELPGPRILNFFMEHALQGGVSRTLALDAHGKSRASLMLTIELEADSPPPSRTAA